MEFKIVFPFQETIFGDNFKEAVKRYIKLNHNLNISNMIVRDRFNQYDTNIKYYNENGRRKIGINMMPVGLNYPIPVVVNTTPDKPILQRDPELFLPTVISSSNVPLMLPPMSPLSPFSPFSRMF